MRLLMPAHTASSTHWPSWSQAPSWWGSPKSPTAIGPVDRRHDLAEGDQARLPGEDVAAADAALRAHDAGALEGQQDLLEVRLRQPGALGDVAHRGGAGLVGVERERQQRPARVVAPRGHLHERGLYGRPLSSGRSPPCSWPTTPSSPPTTAPASRTWCPRCCTHDGEAPAWLPASAPRRRPGRAAGHRRPRLEPAPAAPPPRADARGARRRADHHGRAEHHRHGPHLDHHRAAAGRARRDGLPDRRRRRGAQRAAVDHRRHGDARRRSCRGELQPHAPFGGQRPPVVTRAEFAGVRLHARPPRPGAVHRLPHPRHPHRRAGAPARGPASRFVYAYYEGLDKV